MSEQKAYSPLIGDITKQFIIDEIAPKNRIIVTAANRLECGLILVGARHCDKVMTAQYRAIPEDMRTLGMGEQGFIDQYGQFLSRDDAMHIVTKNGQALIGEDWGTLFSENLH